MGPSREFLHEEDAVGAGVEVDQADDVGVGQLREGARLPQEPRLAVAPLARVEELERVAAAGRAVARLVDGPGAPRAEHPGRARTCLR